MHTLFPFEIYLVGPSAITTNLKISFEQYKNFEKQIPDDNKIINLKEIPDYPTYCNNLFLLLEERFF